MHPMALPATHAPLQVACRPLAVSMGNAIKSVKSCLEKMKLQPHTSDQAVRGGSSSVLARCCRQCWLPVLPPWHACDDGQQLAA